MASTSESENVRAREWLARRMGGPGTHRIEMGETLAAYAAEERARVVARLRARATSEEVNADRTKALDAAFVQRFAAQVLRDEADRLEQGT